MIFILGGILVGQLGELLGNNPILEIVGLLPSYYLRYGGINASQNIGTLGDNPLDIGALPVATSAFLAISTWVLRRQSSVLTLV